MPPTIHIANRKTGYNMCLPGKHHYIGRPTPLGNPFRIGRDGTRREVIKKYRQWLVEQSLDGALGRQFSAIVEDSRKYDVVLECSCAPQRCHAIVVIQLVRMARRGKLIRRHDSS